MPRVPWKLPGSPAGLETLILPWLKVAFKTEAVEIVDVMLMPVTLQSDGQSRHESVWLTRYAQ